MTAFRFCREHFHERITTKILGTTFSQMRRAANTNLLFWVNMHFFKFKISPLDIMDIYWNLWEASMPNSVDLMGDWGCLEVLSLWALYDIEFDLLLMAFFSINRNIRFVPISTICSIVYLHLVIFIFSVFICYFF